MALTTFASGTTGQTAAGAETDIATINVVGLFRLKLDLDLMAAGDVIYVRKYIIVKTGGASNLADGPLMFSGVDGTLPGGAKVVTFDDDLNDLAETDALQYTIEQPFGTTRALPYAVIRDDRASGGATAAEVADAVWDEDATGHQTGGTFGQAIGDPASDTNTIYGAVVTGAAGATVAADLIAVKAETAEILTDTGTTLDGKIDTIDGIVDAILLDTAEIGAAGAGLTAINLPDQTMNITGNITGNLSGSVGSVTGAVGSVSGLTASDIGAIKTKTDFLPSVVAGGTGGVFIAGTNAATTVTTALTTTFTGNLTGSVASVTGAVGSVTGFTASDVGAIKLKTDNLPSDPADASVVAGLIAAVETKVDTVDTVVDAIKVTTDKLDDTLEDDAGTFRFTTNALEQAPSGTGASAAAIADAVWDEDATGHQTGGTFGQAIGDPASDTNTIYGAVVTGAAGATVAADLIAVKAETAEILIDTGTTLDGKIDTIDTVVDAILVDTGTDGVVVASLSTTAIDAILDRTNGVETGFTLRQALRLILSSAAGELSGAETTTVAIRDVNDTKARITATVDADGNRTTVSLDAT